MWGKFLGREVEVEEAIRWANNRRIPMAVLWGFGGNGKTTIQLKLAEDFVYGRNCPLRWPFEGAVWVSARMNYPRGLPSLLDILREIVKTFEPPKDLDLGSTPPAWLNQEAKKLLRKRRVLILLDNFEAISKQNQEEILEFFGWLDGYSQTLISSRYRFDLGGIAHVLIPVNGLLPKHAETLIQDYLKARKLSPAGFAPEDLRKLAEATGNNPKVIIAVLGMVEEGMSLPDLLSGIIAGAPEADEIFNLVIGLAWQEILTETDRAVLMAKSFFGQPVSDSDLGQVAGVSADRLAQVINKLRTISFFERPQPGDSRITTHPLAQDFTHRILRDHPDFESQAEERWWSQYAPRVVQQALRTTYQDLRTNPELDLHSALL